MAQLQNVSQSFRIKKKERKVTYYSHEQSDLRHSTRTSAEVLTPFHCLRTNGIFDAGFERPACMITRSYRGPLTNSTPVFFHPRVSAIGIAVAIGFERPGSQLGRKTRQKWEKRPSQSIVVEFHLSNNAGVRGQLHRDDSALG